MEGKNSFLEELNVLDDIPDGGTQEPGNLLGDMEAAPAAQEDRGSEKPEADFLTYLKSASNPSNSLPFVQGDENDPESNVPPEEDSEETEG